jgi:hypothetical protein
MFKIVIRFFDRIFPQSRLIDTCARFSNYLKIKSLKKEANFEISILYNSNSDLQLARLCEKYGSDKGGLYGKKKHLSWDDHTYTDYYSSIFDHCRDHVNNVFECGIGSNFSDQDSSMGQDGIPGASLRVWRDYFQNAHIFGADIDERVLFQDDRITTFAMDQCNSSSIEAALGKIPNVKFDLIIDDGLHTFDAGITLFRNCFPKLSANGIYCIEDVVPQDLDRFRQYFEKFDYCVNFINLYRPNSALLDNSLVIVRRA